MGLNGSLETIGLADLLSLLSSTGKSGELQLLTERGGGVVWFDGGRLSDHDVPGCPEPADAVFELLRAEGGTFSFSGRAERTGGSLHDVEPLLGVARERLAGWATIAGTVPSLEHRVCLVADPGVERVELSREQWAMVLAIGEGKPVRSVLETLGVGEFPGCRSLKELVDAGLARIEEPPRAPAALPAAAADIPPPAAEAPVDEPAPAEELAPAEDPAPAEGSAPAQDAWKTLSFVTEPAPRPEPAPAFGPVESPGAALSQAQSTLKALLDELAVDTPLPVLEADPAPAPAPQGPGSPVDGLADRGPWTTGELANLNREWERESPAPPAVAPAERPRLRLFSSLRG